MSVFMPTKEGMPVPSSVLPEYATSQLPHADAADLRYLKAKGWARYGVVAAVVSETPSDQPRLLMLEHRPSDKSPASAWGPLAETAQLARSGDKIIVESSAHTLARAFAEEVGVTDVSQLQLMGKEVGAWVLNAWPVGTSYANQQALAVCPVVHLDEEQCEAIQDMFEPTEEITAITFMTPNEIGQQQVVRPGTKEWLRDVHLGLITMGAAGHSPLELPDPTPLAGAVDIKFNSLGFL